MANRSNEQRLKALELRVAQLHEVIESSGKQNKPSWQRSIEKYADDEDLLAVLSEGMKLREAERRKVHNRPTKARKP